MPPAAPSRGPRQANKKRKLRGSIHLPTSRTLVPNGVTPTIFPVLARIPPRTKKKAIDFAWLKRMGNQCLASDRGDCSKSKFQICPHASLQMRTVEARPNVWGSLSDINGPCFLLRALLKLDSTSPKKQGVNAGSSWYSAAAHGSNMGSPEYNSI